MKDVRVGGEIFEETDTYGRLRILSFYFEDILTVGRHEFELAQEHSLYAGLVCHDRRIERAPAPDDLHPLVPGINQRAELGIGNERRKRERAFVFRIAQVGDSLRKLRFGN